MYFYKMFHRYLSFIFLCNNTIYMCSDLLNLIGLVQYLNNYDNTYIHVDFTL